MSDDYDRVVIATANQGKLKEIQTVLADLPIKLLSPSDAGVPAEFDPEEIGASFAEIVTRKAKDYAAQVKLPVLADDSGLVIEALDGKPGIHSKRFISGTDHDRNVEVLRLLQGKEQRTAKFVTVMCLFHPETNNVQLFEGEVQGQIADAEHGSAGFGYDPIFIPDGYKQTFAELGIDIKNTLSHRARALFKVKEFLSSRYAK
jgi:XTP/dITP diphosphohydrolase